MADQRRRVTWTDEAYSTFDEALSIGPGVFWVCQGRASPARR